LNLRASARHYNLDVAAHILPCLQFILGKLDMKSFGFGISVHTIKAAGVATALLLSV
jgi:hypothetical protein